MKVVWTAPAVSDLDAIRGYIARDSKVYSDTMVVEIFEAVDRLMKFPRSGRIVPEESDPNTREVIVGNYRVIYEISGATVRILTVLHSARLYRKPS